MHASRPFSPPLLIALAAVACSDPPTAAAPPEALDLSEAWIEADPAAVDMDPTGLEVAHEAAGSLERMRSLLVVRRSRLVMERYYGGSGPETLADVRSVTKSVLSMLTGIALRRGDLASLDTSLGEILGDAYALTPAQRRVTVRHLLTMTSGFDWGDEAAGFYNEWIVAEDHVRWLLDRPHADEPGSVFVYNSAAVHLLGVVLEEATGRPLQEYAAESLYGPLGVGEVAWEELRDGHVNGGSGVDLRPRDLARLGQLMLQEGWSGERSVLPAVWVRESTNRWVAWSRGIGPIAQASYGLLWWTDHARGAFFAWGFGGQFVYVMPSAELVVVATTEWRGVRDEGGAGPLEAAVMDIIVNHVVEAAR